MPKSSSLLLLLAFPAVALAQPDTAQLLDLFNSIVHVTVDLPNGDTGSGSGVVITDQYVATDCHVLANARGVNIAKYGEGYQPIALKADWKHDLCLLKFDKLAFKPVSMRDSASLKNEEQVFGISYPNNSLAPQPSFGSIKAIYPYDGSVIVRSSAAFALGSSGGALFDQDMNLVGITTFKSPGRQGSFYSLPVEWIKRLLDGPELLKLNTDEQPFWSLPEEQRPFFMRVVLPYQHEKWAELKQIASLWSKQEPNSPDALYYLGYAESEMRQTAEAAQHLTKATALNPRHLEAQLKLAMMAIDAGNKAQAERIRDIVKPLDADKAEVLSKSIAAMQTSATP